MSGDQNKLQGLDPDGYQNRPKNDLFAQNLWRAGTSQNRASIFSFFKPFPVPHYSFLMGKWLQQHGLRIPVEPLGWVEAIIAISWKPQDCRPTPLSSNILGWVWRFRIFKQFLLCYLRFYSRSAKPGGVCRNQQILASWLLSPKLLVTQSSVASVYPNLCTWFMPPMLPRKDQTCV